MLPADLLYTRDYNDSNLCRVTSRMPQLGLHLLQVCVGRVVGNCANRIHPESRSHCIIIATYFLIS